MTNQLTRHLGRFALGALAASALVMSSGAVAQADEARVVVGAGTTFGAGTTVADGTVTTADHCTVAAVGRDSANRLVALSAGHCAKDSVDGHLIELMVDGQQVGKFESHFDNSPNPQIFPGYYDFAFAVLDESKVTVQSENSANVSAGLPGPDEMINTFTKVCKSGLTSGFGCATYVGNGGTDPRTHISTLALSGGDSGGPLFTESGKLLGIASKGTGHAPAYHTDVRDAADYAAENDWVGGGFQPIA